MEIQKAYKLRFYPTNLQAEMLAKTFGCARFIWNQKVEEFNNWKPDQEQTKSKTIKELKESYSFLSEVPYNALEQKLLDWNETKKQFFNKKRKTKIGRPRFKNRRSKQSIRFSYNGFSYKNGSIYAAKLGRLNLVGYDLSTLPIDTCKQITISKDPSGKFYCSILVQINTNPKPLTGKMVGIDLGLKDLFILSDGQVIDNPKWFRENQSKLKKAQQHLSRKTKGSNRREKQRIKVAKVHEKIRFQRNHFLHEVSSKIVTDFDVICIEDLNVKGMVKNHSLALAITDASWSSFVNMLEYKCNWYGKTLAKIDRWYPSSKTCSYCGYKLPELDLGTREWTCPDCGTHHDRDINAAKNILQKGFSDLTGEPIEFGSFPKLPSVESIEYRRGEEVSVRRCTQPLRSV